jgi:hypothetical protein
LQLNANAAEPSTGGGKVGLQEQAIMTKSGQSLTSICEATAAPAETRRILGAPANAVEDLANGVHCDDAGVGVVVARRWLF